VRERDVERYLVERVEAVGGDTRKVQWVGRAGAPDRVVFLPARQRSAMLGATPARTLWVEVKGTEKASHFPTGWHEKQQQREHERMRSYGQMVFVVCSTDDVDVLLRQA
jgi:hypothetical protein